MKQIIVWCDNIIDSVSEEGLSEYIEKDILAELRILEQSDEVKKN